MSGPARARLAARAARPADAVPSQLDLAGQQARPGAAGCRPGSWRVRRAPGRGGEVPSPLGPSGSSRAGWGRGASSSAASACLYRPARRSASAVCRICSGSRSCFVSRPPMPRAPVPTITAAAAQRHGRERVSGRFDLAMALIPRTLSVLFDRTADRWSRFPASAPRSCTTDRS